MPLGPVPPCLSLILAMTISVPAAANAVPKRPPQQPEQGRLQELARTHNYTLGRPFKVRLTPDGERVLFLRASAKDPVADLFVHTVATGQTERLLSAKSLLRGRTEALSAAEKAERERKRIKTGGFTDYQLSRGGDRSVLKLNGQLFIYDFSDARSLRLVLPAEGSPLTPKLAPGGQRLAFVQGNNLGYVELPPTLPEQDSLELEPIFVTTDGTEMEPNGLAEFVAQEEMSRYDGFWWSPDGEQLAYQKNDYREMESLAIADAARPENEPHRFPYPRPGKRNADVRLFVARLETKTSQEVVWDRAQYPYLAKVVWSRGAPLCFLAQARDQQSQAFLRVDLDRGAARPLFEERDEAWLNIHDSTPRFLADGRSFMWATEEDGAWRLERKHLAEDGLSIVRREVVVPGTAHFHSLIHVDETRRWVWFSGGADPAQLHLFKAPLDGCESPTRVTSDTGWYEATFAANGGAVAITHSSLSSLAETRVSAVDESGTIAEGDLLAHESEQPTSIPQVELISFDKGGGFRGAVLRPRNFDKKARYPVILYVYGGPGFHVVRAQMSAWFIQQWMADHGFIVVSVDGRGTPRRGRGHERALRGAFHEVPLEDQIAGLRALAKHVPQMDLDRVGVYGWSFGGYMAALSVLRRPDVFHVGVAGAPVTDWFYYDTHYTERYLGVPEDSEDDVYASANLLNYAAKLSRPLLLIHGVADDNVYFAHTLQLADALFRADKPFELLPLVGLTHQVADPAVREALFSKVVRFLGERLW